MRSLKLSACSSRFLRWTAANRRPKTVEHYRYQLRRAVGALGDVELPTLTPAMVSAWSTKFHAVQPLQRLCNWCFTREKSIDSNPLAGMPRPREGQRRRVLSRAEFVRLCRVAERPFRHVLLFLRETIARPQEVRALTWADVAQVDGGKSSFDFHDPAGSHFSLPTAKGFHLRRDDPGERIIPISPRLARLLRRLRRYASMFARPILRNRNGRAWTANAIRCAMARARRRAGLAADRRGERVVAYSLRHTGATNAAAAGVRDFRLAAVLGHVSPRTTERYVHLRPADLVDAMKTLWEVKTAKRPKNDRPGSLRNDPDGAR